MKLIFAYCLLFIVSTFSFAQEKSIVDSCFVRLQSAITVNSDDQQVRIIQNCYFDSISIRIYNRWGEIMYETNQVALDHSINWEWWKNKELKSEVYVWMIKVHFINTEFMRKTFSGHITVIK